MQNFKKAHRYDEICMFVTVCITLSRVRHVLFERPWQMTSCARKLPPSNLTLLIATGTVWCPYPISIYTVEPKMRANMARYISHIASLLMLAFYVLHFGMRMRTRIYHLRFGGDTVRAKCWLVLMWFIWFSHMFQHFVVISRMSCWSVFSKRDLLFLINLLIQSVYLYAMLYLHVSVHFYLQAHKHVPGFQVPPGLFTLKWVCVRMYCFTLPLWLAFTPPCDW